MPYANHKTQLCMGKKKCQLSTSLQNTLQERYEPRASWTEKKLVEPFPTISTLSPEGPGMFLASPPKTKKGRLCEVLEGPKTGLLQFLLNSLFRLPHSEFSSLFHHLLPYIMTKNTCLPFFESQKKTKHGVSLEKSPHLSLPGNQSSSLSEWIP